jgi:hypothetical protein
MATRQQIASWLSSHSFVSWIIISISVIGTCLILIYIVRTIKQVLREIRKDQQLAQEERNQWKMIQHQVRSNILLGEEWNVDMSALKTTQRYLTYQHKAMYAAEREKERTIVPLFLMMVILVVLIYVLTLWMIIFTLICLLASIIWSIYHGRKWYRYNWLYNQLGKLADDLIATQGSQEDETNT